MKFSKSKEPQAPSEPQYIPLTIGLPKACSSRVLEFLIVGKNKEDNQNRVLQILSIHKAELISLLSCSVNDDHTLFSMSCVVDCSNLSCNEDDLLIAFRKLKFVIRADKASMKDKIFSNFMFPVSLMKNKGTSIILEANTLFDILGNPSKIEAEGRNYSMRVVEALRSPSGFVHSETRRDAHAALVDSIKAYFRACGWGLLNFGFEKRDDQCDLFEVSTVVVSKLPELDASKEDKEVEDCLSVPWIRFLKGFISGLLEVIAPESENNKIVAATFNKYTRTLTFVVAPESDSNNGEILANIQEEKITGTHQQMGEDSNPKTQELVREEIRSFAPSQPEPDSVVLPDTPVPSIVAYTTSPSVDKLQDAPVLGRVASSSEKEKPESFEIIRRILVASKRHSTRISIMHKVGLTFSEARRYLELLTRSELLETRKLSEDLELVSYRTTSKGIDYIETHEKLDQMIDVNYQPAELPNRRVNAKFANSSRANSIPWEESKIWNE